MRGKNIIRVMAFLSLIYAVYCGVFSGLSYGAESQPVITAHTRASLVTDDDSFTPQHPLRLGLYLQLKEGWHTYWKNPGDAGDSPHMDVTISGAVEGRGSAFSWPVPTRISEGGLMAYAYTGHVLLQQKAHITKTFQKTEQGGEKVQIKAHAEWLVCADLCVPEEGDFTLSLPVLSQTQTSRTPSKDAVLFQESDAHMAQRSPFAAMITSDGTLSLLGGIVSSENVKEAWFLPFETGVIQQNAPQKLNIQAGRVSLSLLPEKGLKPPFWTKTLEGVFVLVDKNHNQSAFNIEAIPQIKSQRVEPIKGPIKAIIPGALHLANVTESSWYYGVHYLVFAFLGGLILNLMPCVFPVLTMKALSLVKMGGAERHEQRASGIFYTIGVMGSFLFLGALMIILRFLGSLAGWGFQFQSPIFVIALCWLLLLMALNLLGVFQITIGRFSSGLGQVAHKKGYYGDLITGLLAVIVATPCTAPFMGVAIAGALSGPILLGLFVFLIMGLGLAFPYLLIAVVPSIAARLPRPGAWMEVLKQFLAFPLLATCVWLLWVAVLQKGANFAALGAGGAVLLSFAAWLYGMAQHRAMREGGKRVIFLYYFIALCAVLLSCFALFYMKDEGGSTKMIRAPQLGQGMTMIEPFSQERLATLRAQHRPVFIDMTAAWCITCMVNERVALQTEQVQKAFQEHHIVTLRGDWTNKDVEISAYLKQQGRDGVPLYVYYGADGEVKILPQILTESLILNNL